MSFAAEGLPGTRKVMAQPGKIVVIQLTLNNFL